MNEPQNRLDSLRAAVNLRLIELMERHCEPGVLKDAMSYSLMAGGKRLRPVLCLLSAGMFGDESKALDIACAIEMIHTYSLIHDDLPAMDNDSLRRGKPSNHVVFGEALAILAGDGLLNGAFEVMLDCARREKDSGLDYTEAMRIIAKASGTKGMIAGQTADIEFEGAEQSGEVLHYIHERKTAALITASVTSAAALYKASDTQMKALDTYGRCVGLAFQITDDILDETGEGSSMGKTPGKDAGAYKQTFVRAYGLEESRRIAKEKTGEAISALDIFGRKADSLILLAKNMLQRES